MYYDKIDFSIIEKSYKILEKSIKLPYVIHIVGTNGKGSTGRFLSTYLCKKGFNTLHYSSPHIEKFNERIWINGSYVSDEALEISHKKLQEILDTELLSKLTYFEYTTLLAFLLSTNKDYLVLEAGLGGEFDATNVAKNDLSLITTIDLDHQAFLGNTIEEISKTKMRSSDNVMLVGFQNHNEVYEYAKEICLERNIKFLSINDFSFDIKNIDLNLPTYLKKNLLLVLSSLKFLNIDIEMKLFDDVKFEGRCQKISQNITCDVGHNPLAATALLEEFKEKKVILIYNSYADKDYAEVLNILKPIIKSVEIIKLDDKRVVNIKNLTNVCKNLNIISKNFNINNMDENENYLVFGSFLVVEEFLKLRKEVNENIK